VKNDPASHRVYPIFSGFSPKSAIDFFFVCHSSESWNPVHLNRGSWGFPVDLTTRFKIVIITDDF
jgi:hypothetical protein